MSSTYRSSRTALNIVSRTSRTRSQGPALRKYPLASRRQTSNVAEAEAATATARQTSHPPPGSCNVPAQEPWKGKEATGLQDTLRHADEPSPLSRYHELIAERVLRSDDHQCTIVTRLQKLHDDLRSYTPPSIPMEVATQSFLFRLLGLSTTSIRPPKDVPNGLYLYGDVGTGKSMLMDLFYATLPRNITRKRRVHFHAFMIDVHKRLHAYKTAHPHDGADPVMPISRDIARESTVICLDEFQVTDIVDAMILRRLLECLLQLGVVFVTTSNRHPTELYKNGIQRTSFLPAIDLLQQRFAVVDLDSGTDYRRIPRALQKVYFHPLTPENCSELDKIFHAFTVGDGKLVTDRELHIWGRTLLVPESSDNVARFSFDDLCGRPLSAADYLEVTRRFRTVFVTEIPKMGLGQKDLARRFITFVDACYESHTKLFATSEVPIFQVFSDDTNTKPSHVSDHVRGVMDDLGLSDQQIGHTSLFSGEEELFAFARACSRLVQMGTKEWAAHAGRIMGEESGL